MKRSRWRIGFAGVLILGVQWTIQARSASPEPYNLEEMVVIADRIFVGTVVDERTGRDVRGLPATFTTFTISRALKGSLGEQIRVKQVEASQARSKVSEEWMPGVPEYRLEREYLVFLMPDNALDSRRRSAPSRARSRSARRMAERNR